MARQPRHRREQRSAHEEVTMARSEGKMEKLKEAMEKVLNLEGKHPEKKSVCTMCGKPATQLVDGESSCSDHIEQVYAHQLEDYTSKHLADNEWRKF
jgi:hypothetical protein